MRTRTVHGPFAAPRICIILAHVAPPRLAFPRRRRPFLLLLVVAFLGVSASRSFPSAGILPKSGIMIPPPPHSHPLRSLLRYATLFYTFNRIPINCTHIYNARQLGFHYMPMDNRLIRINKLAGSTAVLFGQFAG